MNRATAEQLIAVVKKLDIVLEELDEVSLTVDDEEQKQRIRRTIGTVVLDLFEGVILEVTRQYPDLDPDPETKE